MHRQHFLQKMSPAIAAVVVLSTAAAASNGHAAAINQPTFFAQAGSTGGTIGKQDKSASGGEVRVPASARRAPARKHHVLVRVRRVPARQHHVSGAAARSTRCPNIVGVWNSWAAGLFGQADTTFYKNGTATHKSGIPGKWWCEGGEIFMQWGGPDVGRGKVARDGKRITRTDGSFAGVVIFSR